MRKSQAQLAEEAEARVRKERARLELARLKNRNRAEDIRRSVAMSVSKAARQDRTNNDWQPSSYSADAETLTDLKRINARTRQLRRDDAYTASIVRAFRRNVVGTGITANVDDQPYRDDWLSYAANPNAIDFEGKRDLLMIQQWAIDEFVTVGECFVVRWRGNVGGKIMPRLQCFEFEQLDRYKLEEPSTGNQVRYGIEIDRFSQPVAYHFYKMHPYDIRDTYRAAPYTAETMRIPADRVCHVFDPERVRQSHGVSRLRPVLPRLNDLAKYDEAQLQAARAEASIALLVRAEDPSPADPLSVTGAQVAYLSQDEEITQFTPQRPGGAYTPFVQAQLRAIAAAVGLSYDQIARDFTQGSFSSQRQASIEDRREFLPLQLLLVTQLLRPVHEEFVHLWMLQHPELSGDYFLGEPSPMQWQGQGFEWVDPEAQGKGIERMMRLGLTSRTIEANMLGRTVQDLDEQQQSDGTRRLLAGMDDDRSGVKDVAIDAVRSVD